MFNRALVTGATSGIGTSVARLLAKKGIPLILTGRDEKRLRDLARELDVDVQTITADLSKPNERVIVVAAIHQIKPQLVINNAGLGMYGEAAELDTRQQMQVLEVNVNAMQELTLEAIKTLKQEKKEGVILNVSSAAAFQVFPYFAVYSATKTYVNQFSESLDLEMKPYGIRVLASCPGVVATNFRVRAGGVKSTDEERKHMMTPEFAAEEIWKQIEKRKPLHTFDWKYRVMTFISKYLVPKFLLGPIMKNQIRSLVEK